jgi:hypothetical protein
MRHLYVALLVFCVSSLVFGQAVILDQNFESITNSGDPITGWTFGNAQTWNLAGYGHNSDKYAGWGEVTAADHWIQTPLLTNPGTLTFWIAAYNNSSSLSVKVQISTNGTTWIDKGTFVSKGAGGDIGLDFIQKTVPIQQVGSYYVRWQTVSYVSGGFYIDDVVCTAIPLTQNFESITNSGDPITGWTFGNAQTWNLAGYGHNSDKYAGWGEVTAADHWVRTPLLVNPGTLNFWIAAYNNSSSFSVKVQVSTNGTTWTDKATFVSKGAGGDFGLDFLEKSVVLNLTGSYYIRWQTSSYVSGGFYIDDVTLTGLVTSVGGATSPRGIRYELSQNFPNPFNPTTTIRFELSATSDVRLRIYDILGREVAELVNDKVPAGIHSSVWNASAMPSGVYFSVLSAGEFRQVKRMVLLK